MKKGGGSKYRNVDTIEVYPLLLVTWWLESNVPKMFDDFDGNFIGSIQEFLRNRTFKDAIWECNCPMIWQCSIHWCTNRPRRETERAARVTAIVRTWDDEINLFWKEIEEANIRTASWGTTEQNPFLASRLGDRCGWAGRMLWIKVTQWDGIFDDVGFSYPRLLRVRDDHLQFLRGWTQEIWPQLTREGIDERWLCAWTWPVVISYCGLEARNAIKDERGVVSSRSHKMAW